MSSVNAKTISASVLSTTTAINLGHTITAGDSSAYTLEITFMDVTSISGTCQLHFTLPDGTYADRDDSDGVTIVGNKVTYLLPEEVYSQRGMVLYVQFLNSNLYTPLKVTFSGIRTVPGTTPLAVTQSYPDWAADLHDFDVAISTVTTLAEGAAATASITGTVPDKVLNLGIPVGATGADGAKGDTGASITSGAIVADDIVFIKDDATTVTLTGAKTALTGPQGPAGGTWTDANALPFTDPGNYFTTDQVGPALQQVGASLAQYASPTGATDGHVLTADGLGGTAWEAASGGGSGSGTLLYTITASLTAYDCTEISIDTATGIITIADHAFVNGDKVSFHANADITTNMPSGVVEGTLYVVSDVVGNTFKLTGVTFTSSGSAPLASAWFISLSKTNLETGTISISSGHIRVVGELFLANSVYPGIEINSTPLTGLSDSFKHLIFDVEIKVDPVLYKKKAYVKGTSGGFKNTGNSTILMGRSIDCISVGGNIGYYNNTRIYNVKITNNAALTRFANGSYMEVYDLG